MATDNLDDDLIVDASKPEPVEIAVNTVSVRDWWCNT